MLFQDRRQREVKRDARDRGHSPIFVANCRSHSQRQLLDLRRPLREDRTLVAMGLAQVQGTQIQILRVLQLCKMGALSGL